MKPRERIVTLYLSRAAFFHPTLYNSPREKHRTKRPLMPENARSPPGRERRQLYPRKFTAPAGWDTCPAYTCRYPIPLANPLLQSIRRPVALNLRKIAARYLQKIYVEECEALHQAFSFCAHDHGFCPQPPKVVWNLPLQAGPRGLPSSVEQQG